jgi:hypothetical protein
MKKLALIALALLGVVLTKISERTPLSDLENLRRLDKLDTTAPTLVLKTRDAFQSVNENALGYLPVMPVLHAEDALAGVALSVSNIDDPKVARGDLFSPFGLFSAVAVE